MNREGLPGERRAGGGEGSQTEDFRLKRYHFQRKKKTVKVSAYCQGKQKITPIWKKQTVDEL